MYDACHMLCGIQHLSSCILSLLQLLIPIINGQVVADYRRMAKVWPFVPQSVFHLQYMCWAHMLDNQLRLPDTSFSGHMCGILAGLVHFFLPKAGSPLKIPLLHCKLMLLSDQSQYDVQQCAS